MPTFNNVKTLNSETVWKTDDGSRKLHRIQLDIGEGKKVEAKTWSDAISKIGWSGDIETYEKDGKMGIETFVKQPQKEGYSGGGGFSGGYQKKTGGGRPQGDNFTMYLSYAKDIAVALIEDGKLDESKFGAVLSAVADGGKTLYESRPDAPKKEGGGNDDKQDLEELNKVFGDTDSFSVEGEDQPKW